ELLRRGLYDQQRLRRQPRRHRLQRPHVVTARRARLLDVLHRRELWRRLPHDGAGRLRERALWPDRPDLIRAAGFGRLSVQRAATLVTTLFRGTREYWAPSRRRVLRDASAPGAP